MFLKVSPYVCLKKFGKEMGGKNICLFKKILKRCGKYRVKIWKKKGWENICHLRKFLKGVENIMPIVWGG